MNFYNIDNLQYIDWKVKPVMRIKDTFGFRIILIMSDGTEKVQQKSGFSTKKIANNNRNNTITALTNGTYIINEKIKLKEFIMYWIEKVIKPTKTDNTYKAFSYSIKKYIIPNLGKINLTEINRGHIEKLLQKVYSKSKSQVYMVRTILKNAFIFANIKKIMSNNPVINAKLPKGIKGKPYRTLNIETKNTLNLEQINKLIKVSKDSKIYIHILFGALMGLRKSEILGLKYSDIDYIHRTIKVQRQLGIKANTNKNEFAPKTYTKQEIGLKTFSSYREINIPDFVFEEILKQRKIYEANRNRRKRTFQDLDYICCSASGRPRGKSFIFEPFKKVLKENNLPNIRWHDLRSSYATLLLKNNYNAKAVVNLLGHSKEIITVDVYGDNKNIIEDCLVELEPYINEVIPHNEKNMDFSDDNEYIDIMNEYLNDIIEYIYRYENMVIINDYSNDKDYIDIIEKYIYNNKINELTEEKNINKLSA